MSGNERHQSARLAGAQLVAGAAIGLVGNALHPHTADPSTAATLAAISQNAGWVGIHVAIIVAIGLVAGGVLSLAGDVREVAVRPLARLSAGAAMLGAALVTTSTAIDGFAMKPLATDWSLAGADRAASLLDAAAAVKAVDFAIWSVGMLVMFGVTFISFGVVLAGERRRSPVFAWAAVLSGIGSAVAATLQIAAGGEVQLAESIFLGSSMLITVWAFALGVTTWREASDPRDAMAPAAQTAR